MRECACARKQSERSRRKTNGTIKRRRKENWGKTSFALLAICGRVYTYQSAHTLFGVLDLLPRYLPYYLAVMQIYVGRRFPTTTYRLQKRASKKTIEGKKGRETIRRFLPRSERLASDSQKSWRKPSLRPDLANGRRIDPLPRTVT